VPEGELRTERSKHRDIGINRVTRGPNKGEEAQFEARCEAQARRTSLRWQARVGERAQAALGGRKGDLGTSESRLAVLWKIIKKINSRAACGRSAVVPRRDVSPSRGLVPEWRRQGCYD